MPQIVTATNDGFLYVSCRTSEVEAVDEKGVKYEVRQLEGKWGQSRGEEREGTAWTRECKVSLLKV